MKAISTESRRNGAPGWDPARALSENVALRQGHDGFGEYWDSGHAQSLDGEPLVHHREEHITRRVHQPRSVGFVPILQKVDARAMLEDHLRQTKHADTYRRWSDVALASMPLRLAVERWRQQGLPLCMLHVDLEDASSAPHGGPSSIVGARRALLTFWLLP